MSGVHRGRRGLRWRLVVAVMAAAVGQGYRGRHRLVDAVLGLAPETLEVAVRADAPSVEPPAATPADDAAAPVGDAAVLVGDAARPELGAPLPLHVTGTRLAVVPVPPSPDPLVDTMPHPVVKLFPMPVVDHDGTVVAPAGRHESEVFADVDASREAAALEDLAHPTSDAEPYHGRHTA